MSIPVATPSQCPTHYFHLQCLAQHVTKDRRCPIDKVACSSIVVEDTKGCSEEEEERGAVRGQAVEDYLEQERTCNEKKSDQLLESMNLLDSTIIQNNCGFPVNLPSDSRTTLQENEEDPRENGGEILVSKKQFHVTLAQSNESPNIDCGICQQNSPGIPISPDCCEHWFHKDCFIEYTQRHSVCPVRGCYREITTYVCGSGEFSSLQLSARSEQENVLSAPKDFLCEICFEADVECYRAEARPCGHVFHRICVVEFVRRYKMCPKCQNPTRMIFCKMSGEFHFE